MSLARNATDPISDLRERLEAHHQAHVLRHWAELDGTARERLRCQILTLDLEALALARRRALAAAPDSDLTEPRVVRLPEHGGDELLRRRARQNGEERLAAGRVGVLVVAGGQGTRLGHVGPKGTFPIGPVSRRSLFALQAQGLHGLARRFGRPVPWLVMTSSATDTATRAFFAAEDHFGLDPGNVIFLVQGEVPCVDFEGRLILEAPDRIAHSPDGHGGVVPALAHSGALAELAARGVESLAYYQVDNPLVPIGDPVLMGLQDLIGAELVSKVVSKRTPAERVGTLACRENRPVVVEYTEIREPARSERGPDGGLRFWAGAIGVHALDVKFLGRVAERADVHLPYHLSAKRIPTIDAEGRRVVPSEPSGYKLERFVFDLLPVAARATGLEVQREEEYAPVKNAHGPESPATGRDALTARARAWLSEAGIEAPADDLAIEVDPSRIGGVDDLRALGIQRWDEAGGAILTGTGDTA